MLTTPAGEEGTVVEWAGSPRGEVRWWPWSPHSGGVSPQGSNNFSISSHIFVGSHFRCLLIGIPTRVMSSPCGHAKETFLAPLLGSQH